MIFVCFVSSIWFRVWLLTSQKSNKWKIIPCRWSLIIVKHLSICLSQSIFNRSSKYNPRTRWSIFQVALCLWSVWMTKKMYWKTSAEFSKLSWLHASQEASTLGMSFPIYRCRTLSSFYWAHWNSCDSFHHKQEPDRNTISLMKMQCIC